MARRHLAVLLPGGVLPAELAYAELLQVLGERVDAVAKDLEVYSEEQPPPDFSLDTEVEGILREADDHGFDRFHLVGYSAGGASSLAFAAVHRERLASLALLEPA
jgi:pimeloyl-ACP methyl ester carboxylesterase